MTARRIRNPRPCAFYRSTSSHKTQRHRNRLRTRQSFKSCQKSPRTPSPPCTVFLGENFTVSYSQCFKFHKLVTDATECGLIQTSFYALRQMKNMHLSDNAIKIQNVPNAGGNSVLSEVMSFELLHRCFGAQLLKTEMEVTYFPEGGSITDYVCAMSGVKMGVSVTRAMKYHGDYTKEDAEKLLNKKLTGIVQSSRNTMDKWSKQILHVWATSKHVANTVTKAFDQIDNDIRSNTLVLVTVAEQCSFIFANK